MLAAIGRRMAELGNTEVAVEPMGAAALVAFGPGRYVNRAIGLGPDLDRPQIATIDRFYAELGLPAALQLSSTARPETLTWLEQAGFRLTSFRSVYAGLPDRRRPDGRDPDRRRLGGDDHDRYRLVAVDEHNEQQWLDVLAEGNETTTAAARATSDEYARAAHRVEGSVDVLAWDGDQAVGCGSIHVIGDTAWLGGAATRPTARNRGVQGQLLRYRLGLARDRGCRMVAATATPGGPSARNLIRAGLRLVDTQVVLSR